MTVESPFVLSPGWEARILTRNALWASLASLDRVTGFPYVSKIAVATNVSGEPLFLISTLARHTQNLEFDGRASILFSAACQEGGNPLDAGRVSVMGRACVLADQQARARFLARHPETVEYVGFSDFALWTLLPELGHYVGGFGRIHTLTKEELTLDDGGAAAFAAAQAECLEALNARSAVIERLAITRLGAAAGPWRVSGVDPEGCDFLLDRRSLRLNFNRRLESLDEVAALIDQMAKES